jgi:hypothetical protein
MIAFLFHSAKYRVFIPFFCEIIHNFLLFFFFYFFFIESLCSACVLSVFLCQVMFPQTQIRKFVQSAHPFSHFNVSFFFFVFILPFFYLKFIFFLYIRPDFFFHEQSCKNSSEYILPVNQLFFFFARLIIVILKFFHRSF